MGIRIVMKFNKSMHTRSYSPHLAYYHILFYRNHWVQQCLLISPPGQNEKIPTLGLFCVRRSGDFANVYSAQTPPSSCLSARIKTSVGFLHSSLCEEGASPKQ